MKRALQPGDRIRVNAKAKSDHVGKTAHIARIGANGIEVVEREGRAVGLGPFWGSAFSSLGALTRIRNEKANDNIPADEMLLAETIAFAKGKGLEYVDGHAFKLKDGSHTSYLYQPDAVVGACALGALALMAPADPNGSKHYQTLARQLYEPLSLTTAIISGNDSQEAEEGDNRSEQFGISYRKAMQD